MLGSQTSEHAARNSRHSKIAQSLPGTVKKVVTGLDEVEEERNVAWILDLACRNESIARGVEKLWTARFVQE